MVCITRIFGGLLVGFLGLVLYSPSAFADTLPNQSLALQACIARSDSYTGTYTNTTSTIETEEVYRSKCVFNAALNDRYVCVYILDVIQTRISDNQTNDFHYAGFCNGSPPAGFNQRPTSRQGTGEAAQPWYDNYVPITTGNTVSCSTEFNFCFEDSTCSAEVEFDTTTMRAPTSSGTGTVCYDSCQHIVSWWYSGTYPAGELVYTFSPTGAVCAPNDLEPEPIPNDDLPEDVDPDTPLDLDPEDGGVDKPIDPGSGRDEDGHGSSSGGGSCDSPPACTGEPIQCNILFQTWSTRCAIAGGEGGEGGDGEILGDIRDGVDGLRGDLSGAFSDGGVGDGAGLSDVAGLVGNKTFGPDDIDAGGWGFPRSCPLWSDVSFAVGTTNIVLPLSTFTLHCDIFEWTGYLIVAFAAFWASMIIIRGD